MGKKFNRDLKDPTYKKFRQKVFERDNYQCQFPLCYSKRNLEIHHIRRYSDYPKLRTAVYNGIALCRGCHSKVTGKEKKYESMFYHIVASKTKGFSTFLGIKKQVKKKRPYINGYKKRLRN